MAYPKCFFAMWDKIAQFISTLSNGYVKRTLQSEGVTSLKLEKAKAIKIIQEESFEKRENVARNFEKKNREKREISKEGISREKGNEGERER